jgi:hypothetical protein
MTAAIEDQGVQKHRPHERGPVAVEKHRRLLYVRP